MRFETISNDGDIASLTVGGQITQSAFDHEEEPLAAQFGEGIYATRLLLGLQGADYMDSRGVGWLLKCHRRFRRAGGIFVIHSLPPVIRDVLKVLHLDTILNVENEEQAARERALATADE